MQSEKIKLRSLLREIEHEHHIAIYGCGDYGRTVQTVLQDQGINTEFFIVTQIEKTICENGVPVFPLNECADKLKRDEFFIIVCVCGRYEQEILENLNKNELNKFVCISNYMLDEIGQYIGRSGQDYIDNINEWCFLRGRDPIKSINVDLKRKRNRVTVVIEEFRSRVYNIVSVLEKKGYELEIYMKKSACVLDTYEPMLKKWNVDTIEYNSIEELMYHLLKSVSSIIFFFPAWDNYNELFILLQQKQMFPPIILDIYDMQYGMYLAQGTEQLLQMTLERFCIEYADGICTRETVYQYMQEHMHMNISEKCLLYMDYFYMDDCCNIIGDEDELSLCYVGGIATEKEDTGYSGACFLELGEMCEKNKCHLHIYPSSYEETRFKDYIEYSQKNRYFHFHMPKPYEELIREIAQYDYGIFPCKRNARQEIFKGYTKYKRIYASANKYFDYLCAGLPIIAVTPVKLMDEFDNKGILLRWFIEDYDFSELRKVKCKMRENVATVRDEFSIEAHMDELIGFIEKIKG